MILKLTKRDVVHLIECDAVRCQSKFLKDKEEAAKWEKNIGGFWIFEDGIDRVSNSDFPIRGCHITIIRRSSLTSEFYDHAVAYESGIYLMNNDGKTVEIFNR